MKRTFRIYGREGHSFRFAHFKSENYDFSIGPWARPMQMHVANSDETGTTAYSEVTITAPTNSMIIHELWAQIDDGIFEDCRSGRVTEIVDGNEIDAEYPRH